MIELLTALNSVTPLGLAVLLALVLWKISGTHGQLRQIQANGFGKIPEMLRRIEATLARIEAAGLIRDRPGYPYPPRTDEDAPPRGPNRHDD